MSITSAGLTFAGTQGAPDYGTPAFVVFDGYVDFAGTPNPSIELDVPADLLTYTFTGLDVAAEYNFQGTAIRGDSTYTNRWTLFEITDAASSAANHTSGTLKAPVGGMTTNQVAVNTNSNTTGDLAW